MKDTTNIDNLECVNCGGAHSELLKDSRQLVMDQQSMSSKEHCSSTPAGQGGCGKKKRRRRRRKSRRKSKRKSKNKRKSRRKSKNKRKKRKTKRNRRK